MDSLITKLQSAGSGSRELDAEIAMRFGRDYGPVEEWDVPGRTAWVSDECAAHYTTSLDAALALVDEVLPGWSWDLSGGTPSHGVLPYATLNGSNIDPTIQAEHKSPVIALLIALLRALPDGGGDE